MEAAVLVPQQVASLALPAAEAGRRAAGGVSSIPRAAAGAAARRKTLCDITNMTRLPAAVEKDGSLCAAGVSAEEVAQLVKENLELVRLLEERDKIIELSGTELQKLRQANWHLAQANSQMLAEINNGKDRLKAFQHELACSRAIIRAKTSELEEAKKTMKHNRNMQGKAPTSDTAQQQQGCERAAQIKGGDVVNSEPASDTPSHGASAKKLSNATRKRMLRSRSLGPGASVKLAAPKEKEMVQRRKSMRTPVPQPSEHREDLFEIEDVQLAIGDCSSSNTDKNETLSEQSSSQFPRRSSLGRPIRRATERVSSYKEPPVNIKLRRS
uniref:Shugoshin C-terminal domain-containing protein n=1 Tax=Leersia perrieri TaxID=77586 RepID=A0A0D9XKB1_9ORYZ